MRCRVLTSRRRDSPSFKRGQTLLDNGQRGGLFATVEGLTGRFACTRRQRSRDRLRIDVQIQGFLSRRPRVGLTPLADDAQAAAEPCLNFELFSLHALHRAVALRAVRRPTRQTRLSRSAQYRDALHFAHCKMQRPSAPRTARDRPSLDLLRSVHYLNRIAQS